MNSNKQLIAKYDANTALFVSDHEAIGTAATTVLNYKRRLQYFREFLGKNKVSVISSETIRAWRDGLLSDGLKPATVKQYMIELKCFFEAVTDPVLGYYEQITKDNRNPISAKMLPKIPDVDRQYQHVLSDDDMSRLWANKCPAGNAGMSATWARNYAIVVLLLDSKIRNSELLGLTLEDVDFSRGEILIRRGKGGKVRCVSISEIAVTALKLYLASGLRPAHLTEKDYLFGTESVKGIKPGEGGGNTRKGAEWHKGTTQWLSQLVERHVRNITGKAGFRTHSMRHAGAALDLNSGERLERIQAELGHSSVTTTERYTDRLKSVSRTIETEKVIEQRNTWAERNNHMIEGLVTATA